MVGLFVVVLLFILGMILRLLINNCSWVYKFRKYMKKGRWLTEMFEFFFFLGEKNPSLNHFVHGKP